MFMAFPRRMVALPRLLNPYDTPVQAYSTSEEWLVGLAYDHNAPFALN
jgi:hypothetical protein